MSAFDIIQSAIQPIIVELLLALIFAFLAWIGRFVPSWLRLRIDQINREALHRALDTGVGLALDTVQMTPQVAASDAAVTQVIRYARSSVPGALRHFVPSDEQLAAMARSKLNQAIARARSADKLTEALAQAGAPAIKP